MIRGLDHIGIAVKNLNEALKFFRDILKLKLIKIEEVEAEKVKIGIFDVNGVYIELLEPISKDSSIAKFIEKRGEGIHHIALSVKNISAILNTLKSKGLNIIYESPLELSDRRINFIHPRSSHGVLLEIIERISEVD